MAFIDRFNKQGPLVDNLAEEKQRLEEALGASTSRVDQLEALEGDLQARLGEATEQVESERKKNADLEALVESLRNDLQAESKRADEAVARVKSESEAAFQDAATQATVYYGAKVFRVRDKAWLKGWRAALREAGVSEDHPSFADPPSCPGPSAPDNTVIIERTVVAPSGSNPREAPADIPSDSPSQEF